MRLNVARLLTGLTLYTDIRGMFSSYESFDLMEYSKWRGIVSIMGLILDEVFE